MICCTDTAGTKQSGVALNDIVLPPWAKGDPHEFIRMHRVVSRRFSAVTKEPPTWLQWKRRYRGVPCRCLWVIWPTNYCMEGARDTIVLF